MLEIATVCALGVVGPIEGSRGPGFGRNIVGGQAIVKEGASGAN